MEGEGILWSVEKDGPRERRIIGVEKEGELCPKLWSIYGLKVQMDEKSVIGLVLTVLLWI
jgi:hypothetical protein